MVSENGGVEYRVRVEREPVGDGRFVIRIFHDDEMVSEAYEEPAPVIALPHLGDEINGFCGAAIPPITIK